MKMKIIGFILLTVLMIHGCGGGSSSDSSSSFELSDNFPVINHISTSNEQNISSIVTEENGEYKIYVNDNQRTTLKIEATDESPITFSIGGDDFNFFDINSSSGEIFFKEPTNYETKKIYIFKIIIRDAVGHLTSKNVKIYVKNTINKSAPIIVEKTNSLLSTTDESKYFITTWKTDNNGISNDNQITIPTLGDGYNYRVNWGDGTRSEDVTTDITHSYNNIGTYTVKISGDFPRIVFGKNSIWDGKNETYSTDNLKLLSLKQWGKIKWKSMSLAFTGCKNLNVDTIDRPILSDVTDMSNMFNETTSFNQDIESWDVSNVTYMSYMFDNTPSLEKLPSWYHE